MRSSTPPPDEFVLFRSILETARLLEKRAVSPTELVDLTLARIERLNGILNAYISFGGEVEQQVRDAERRWRRGQPCSLLDGIPVSVKDLVLTRDFPTTAGSRVLGDGLRRQGDALLVKRLRRAGAILVGKTNLHEFAYGVTNENAHFGPARNPWDSERVSGGSSGGSAVAVAAGMSFASIGTDTRGSIRIPSACCGITGLKPSLGRIPTKGILPLSWTLDHAGPMTRSTQDAAAVFAVLDSPRRRPRPPEAAGPDLQGLRLGICDYYWRNLDPQLERPLEEALDLFRRSGFSIRSVEIDGLDEALDASRIIAGAEAAAIHERYLRERRDGYDPAVLRRLDKSRRISGVDLAKALRHRARLIEGFHAGFRQIDCLLGAAVPALPPRVGEDFLEIGAEKSEVVENLVRFNSPQNVAGIPALVLPGGFTRSGLPVGLQLIAGRHREPVLFRLGTFYQSETDWHLRRPPVG